MTKLKYKCLAKTFFCLSILLNANSVKADPLDLEGPNLIGPRKPNRPKQDWEDRKPQGSTHIGKIKSLDYFKGYPELLYQASKNLTGSKRSFIIQKEIDENSVYDDPRQ